MLLQQLSVLLSLHVYYTGGLHRINYDIFRAQAGNPKTLLITAVKFHRLHNYNMYTQTTKICKQ